MPRPRPSSNPPVRIEAVVRTSTYTLLKERADERNVTLGVLVDSLIDFIENLDAHEAAMARPETEGQTWCVGVEPSPDPFRVAALNAAAISLASRTGFGHFDDVIRWARGFEGYLRADS